MTRSECLWYPCRHILIGRRMPARVARFRSSENVAADGLGAGSVDISLEWGGRLLRREPRRAGRVFEPAPGVSRRGRTGPRATTGDAGDDESDDHVARPAILMLQASLQARRLYRQSCTVAADGQSEESSASRRTLAEAGSGVCRSHYGVFLFLSRLVPARCRRFLGRRGPASCGPPPLAHEFSGLSQDPQVRLLRLRNGGLEGRKRPRRR